MPRASIRSQGPHGSCGSRRAGTSRPAAGGEPRCAGRTPARPLYGCRDGRLVEARARSARCDAARREAGTCDRERSVRTPQDVIPLGDARSFERRSALVRWLRLAVGRRRSRRGDPGRGHLAARAPRCGVASPCLLDGHRRPGRVGKHLVRHLRPDRRDARPPRALERGLRADPVLGHRLPGAPAKHARSGAPAAAAVLHDPSTEKSRRAAAGAAQPVDGGVLGGHQDLDRSVARTRCDPGEPASSIRPCCS